MKFYTATTNITPEQPVFLHGFPKRTHKSEGVHDPIYAKAVLLQANKNLLLISIDAMGSDHSFILGVKDELLTKFGLNHDEVLINFSHSHSSIFLTGTDLNTRRGGYSIGAENWPLYTEEVNYTEDENYYFFVREAIVQMTDYCLEHLIEGELLIGSAESAIGVSRRMPSDKGILWEPNFAAEIDKELLVMKLVDTQQNLKAILYNYGCHTTSVGSNNYLISAEFVGKTSAFLQLRYPGVTAMFLQGCAAEIKPTKSASGGQFKSCNLTEMEEIGIDFAYEVANLVDHGPFQRIGCKFKTLLTHCTLKTELTAIERYETIVADSNLMPFYRNAAARTIDEIRKGTAKESAQVYISVWYLDEETRLIAIEGEVSTEYAMNLKRIYGNKGKTIVLGYTNGVLFYIPTAKMIKEGGYETDSQYLFGLRGPFVPEIEDLLLGRIVKANLDL